jgi:hypothetical protein
MGLHMMTKGLAQCSERLRPWLTMFIQCVYVWIISSWFTVMVHRHAFLIVTPIQCWIAGLFHLKVTGNYEIDGLLSIIVLGTVAYSISFDAHVIEVLFVSIALPKIGMRPNAFSIHLGSIQSFCVVSYTLYTAGTSMSWNYEGTLHMYLASIAVVWSFVPWARPTEEMSKQDTWLLWSVRWGTAFFFTWVIGSKLVETIRDSLVAKGAMVFEAMATSW